MSDAFHTGTEFEAEPRPRSNVARWLRSIMARNPLYPLSAALLLLGINRLSVDPAFLPIEEAKLLFNFSAIQCYEFMLVGVALLLARRHLHYDSTLLSVIENGLVFVPFILVTQAVLIGRDMAALLCGVAAVLAGVRFGLLRRASVLLPRRLLTLGGCVLLMNLLLPFVYRSQMELDATDWLVPGRVCWLVLLPMLVLSGNLLEQPRHWSDEPHRQSWLPLLMLGLWTVATAIHLRCIDYISGLPFQLVLVAPLLWAGCWTAYFRLGDFTPDPAPRARAALLAMPMAVPFLDISLENTYLALDCGNILFFGMVLARTRDRIAFHMLIGSLALVLAGSARIFLETRTPIAPAQMLCLALAGYALMRSMLSRNPAAGFLGALGVSFLPGFLTDAPFVHLAFQIGAAFLLIHSLWWEAPEDAGARQLRWIAGVVWVCDSGLWTWRDPAAFHIVGSASVVVLGACGLARLRLGFWPPSLVPVAATLSLMAAPGHFLFDKASASPTGLLAVIGSFLLFGLGTAAALTRSSWNPSASRNNK